MPGATFAERLRNIERYGFDGVEARGYFLNKPEDLANYKAALRDSPVKVSTICGGHPPEMVHPDPERRRVCIDTLKRHLDLAADLGAAGVITVPIFNENDRLPDLWPWKSRAEAERELLLAVLGEIVPHAAGNGTAILLEPLNRYESDSLPNQEYGADVVRELGGKGVRLMCDVFHMNLEEFDSAATIRACADVIGHVHLADNTRKQPGSGSIDFRKIMGALKDIDFTGYMAFECGRTGPPEEVFPRSVAYIRECMA